MYTLRCFGRLLVENHEKERVQFRSKKHLALLLYLASHSNRRHDRARLARLFWDTEISLARHSLSQALYDIRCHLPELTFARTATQVGLSLDILEYEATTFEREVAANNLDQASRIYRGSFAPDIDQVSGLDFERWVDRERARFRSLAEKALLHQITLNANGGNWGKMCLAASRIIDINPFSSQAHVAIIRGFWLGGDKQNALRHYEEYKKTIAREMSAEASMEIRKLITYIQRNDPVEHSERYKTKITIPFVGRNKTFRYLLDAFRSLERDSAGYFLIRGESGIGKTRLLSEFANRVDLTESILLSSKCYPGESTIPYAPLVEGIRPILQEKDSDLFDRNPGHLSRLLRRPTESQPGLNTGGRSRQIAEDLRNLIMSHARSSPIVWLLDDLQWADQTSLAILDYLADRITGMPVLIVGSLRTGEHASYLTVGRWKAVNLRPLSMDDIQEAVTTLNDVQKTDFEPDLLARLSGGNPLLLTELLKRPDLYRAIDREDRQAITDAPSIHSSLKNVITKRLQSLPEPSLRILDALAVAGRHVTPQSLSAIVGVPASELIEYSQPLYDRGFLRDDEGGIVFKHGIVQHYVYESLGRIARSLLHSRTAELLERQDNVADHGVIARHYSLAGNKTKAEEIGLRAAEDAYRCGAYPEARRMASLAVQAKPGTLAHTRAHHLLALSQFHLGQFEEAMHSCEAIEDPSVLSPSKRTDLEILRAQIAVELSSLTAVRESINRLDELGSTISASDQLWARYLLLKAAVRAGDSTLAEKIMDGLGRSSSVTLSMNESETINGQEAARVATMIRVVYELFYGSLKRAKRESERIARLPQDISGIDISYHQIMSIIAARSADWDRAIAANEKAYSYARKRNIVPCQLASLSNLAAVYVDRGEWQAAEKLINRASGIAECATKESDSRVVYDLVRADYYFYTENFAKAADLYYNLHTRTADGDATTTKRQLIVSYRLAMLALGRSDTNGRSPAKLASLYPVGTLSEPTEPGFQDRYKRHWLSAFSMLETNKCVHSVVSSLKDIADEERSIDLPGAAKTEWLALLFLHEYGDERSRKEPTKRDTPGNALQEVNSRWFAYFSRRWLRRARRPNHKN